MLLKALTNAFNFLLFFLLFFYFFLRGLSFQGFLCKPDLWDRYPFVRYQCKSEWEPVKTAKALTLDEILSLKANLHTVKTYVQ